MKLDSEEVLFSLKCFVAGMLAFYIALSIGLDHPYWAVTTSYIVAQPLSGAVLSKAVFRLMGTALGAAAAVVLVPAFVNEPPVLSAALGLWLAFCLYVSLLDRTPRAYTFLLAGYTASIIGFPSVDAPGGIFDTAILRVQEITIGILCGSFVHGVIFPRTVTARLLGRIDAILADAERWTREALDGSPHPTSAQEQRRIALDLSELDQLVVHLPFDTARLLPRTRTVRAFQDRLLELLPLGGTVKARLVELEASGGLLPDVAGVVSDTSAWLAGPVRDSDRDVQAAALVARLDAIAERTGTTHWRDMLVLNLCARLGDLIGIHRDLRDVHDQIHSPSVRAISPHVAELLERSHGRSVHLDRGLALRSAAGTFMCIVTGCALWISTAWPEGAGAVLIAGVACALFGNADRPGPMVFKFLIGSTTGLIAAMIYAYAILPRVTTFESFAGVMAPALLLIGALMARPAIALMALGIMIGFVNTVGFNATYTSDFASFVNGAIAQTVGIGFAVVWVTLFQTVGTDTTVGRLFRAGWRDVARRAAGRSDNEPSWASRMLDRVGLLLPRLAGREPGDTGDLLDALVDMRTGLVAGRLRAMSGASTPAETDAIAATLSGIAAHFRRLDPRRPTPAPGTLLADIDRGFDAFAADPDRDRSRTGLVLLTSLRRNLFPTAPGYEAAA